MQKNSLKRSGTHFQCGQVQIASGRLDAVVEVDDDDDEVEEAFVWQPFCFVNDAISHGATFTTSRKNRETTFHWPDDWP